MNKYTDVILKPGRDKALRQRHHWIFSGAIQSLPSFKDGDLLPVYAAHGKRMGTGYFNHYSGIIGRMIAFDETPPLEHLSQKLKAAIHLRHEWFDLQHTNAYRLVNGEGDGIPGLILDIYNQAIVLQSSTKGIDCLKPWIVDWLKRYLKPQLIYEKSLLPSRKEEKLEDFQGYLSGEKKEEISFKENDLLFTLSLPKSQKTGFFLDHREMRQWVRHLARGRNVLNAFSYTGGFSVYALAGGAKRVDSVDISEEAVLAAQKHILLNGWNPQNQGFFLRRRFCLSKAARAPL